MECFRPESFYDFLQKLGLCRHASLLQGQGYETLGDLFSLKSQDLDSVSIKKDDEREAILAGVESVDIATWLSYHGLATYERHFRRHNLTRIGEIRGVKIDDDLMDELEVMVPGHRKRLSVAVSQLGFPDNVSSSPPSGPPIVGELKVVARGCWGKREAVPTYTKLLWVNDCYLKSNVPGQEAVKLEDCLLDTASEVVTCKHDIVTDLCNLEFIRNIGSKGIHKQEEKPLYRGILILGEKEIEVEVMPDSYNSVGSNVVRQFAHYIDQNQHLWLTK